ncbi:major facilitator superfamily domain-containing protein [Mycena rosella]|uniref:Lysosomal dipeptide transporter MFSD1 n=1 Tax=Mycena rosella TaxID=1033263 RepID=A0AAD7GEM5_MYCRO|nr:major facilitator superfamily domain-containing protein [Mycena rosella]
MADDTHSRDEKDEIHSAEGTSDAKLANVPHLPADSDVPEDFPLKWKIYALSLALLLPVGSSFSENTLGPLKPTLVRELKITNAQYGAIASATGLVNSILPIFGGFLMDYVGVNWGSMFCSVFIFVGSMVSALGSNYDSFNLILGGRVIMGLGSTMIEAAASKIETHWFRKRGLGFVFGFDIAFGKIVVLAAKACAVPMRDAAPGFWGWALWIPCIICFFNLLQNIWYVWWTTTLPEWTRIPTGRERAAAEGRTRRFRYLPDMTPLKLLPRMFFFFTCTQILQAGIVGGFNGLSADIIKETRGSTELLAGYTSSVQQVIPIFLTPALGGFFDRFGFRMLFVSFTSALWIMVYACIGFTRVHPLFPMVFASVAQSFNAMPFICSLPLLSPEQTNMGMIFGVWKAFANAGSVVVDMVAGTIQDHTPGETYARVLYFFISMKALEFCLGAFYGLLDRRVLGGVLTVGEPERNRRQAAGLLDDLPGRRPSALATAGGFAMLGATVVVAWVLFFLFSID